MAGCDWGRAWSSRSRMRAQPLVVPKASPKTQRCAAPRTSSRRALSWSQPSRLRRLKEGGHRGMVLATRLSLDPAGDVDRIWMRDGNRLGDVAGVQPTGENRRNLGAPLTQQTPVETLAGATPEALRAFVEEVEVSAKGLRRVNVGGAGHVHRLNHLDPGFARHLAAERRPLFSIQLHHGQPGVLYRLGNLVQLRIHKDPNNLALAPERSRNPHSFIGLNRARALRKMNQADSPCPKQHSLSRVVQIGNTTDLHPHLYKRT